MDYIESETGISRGVLSVSLPSDYHEQWSKAASDAAEHDSDAGGVENLFASVTLLRERLQGKLSDVERTFSRRRSRGMETLRAIHADISSRAASSLSNPVHNVLSLPLSDTEKNIQADLAAFTVNHKDLVIKENDAQHAWLNFLKKHQRVNRSAPLPDRVGASVGWIVAAMICEVVWNGLFFKNASEHGMVGAVMDVLVIAPANVALATIIGIFTWRYVCHTNLMLRLFGWITSISLGVAIFSYNVFIAAVRMAIRSGKKPEIPSLIDAFTLASAIKSLDYNTVGIFIFGLIFAGFAVHKAHGILHPYPGYGPVLRRLDRARLKASAHEHEQLNAVRYRGQEAEERFDDAIAKWNSDAQRARRLTDGLADDVRTCRDRVAEILNMHALCLKIMRSSYLRYAGMIERLPGELESSLVVTDALDMSITEAEQLRDECSRIVWELRTKSQEYQSKLSALIADSMSRVVAAAREVRAAVGSGAIIRPFGERDKGAAA